MTAIAVVGIGCRLPGYIDSPDDLWAALLAGIGFVTDIPQQRWNADDYYVPVPGAPGRSVSRWGAFFDDPSGFDHRFFLRHDRGFAAYAHFDGAPWLTALSARSPFGGAMSQAPESAADPARRLRVEFRHTPPDERPALLRRLISEHLGVILRRTVNPDHSFFDYGLDSLGTLQLLMALEADTGIRLPAADVATVRALPDTLSGAMQELQLAEAVAHD